MRITRIIIATTLLGSAGIAAADSGETADAAYARGQSAYHAGRVHEACDAFAASDKLSPRAATEEMLATCYEQDGKLLAAARVYRALADKDTNGEQKKQRVAKAAKLEAKAPKLRFAINPVPPGLIVKVDGVEVSSTEDVPVDVGPHEVIATAPGYAGHATAAVDRDRAIYDVIVRMEPRAEAPAPAAEPAPAAAPAPALEAPEAAPAAAASPPPMAMAMTDEPSHGDHRRRNGIIAGSIGAAALITSAVMYGLAQSKFDDEHSLCPDSKCANNADLAKANSQLSDARTYRDIGIGTSIGAGILLAAGGYLLFAPHKDESHVSVNVGHDGAGVAYTFGF
jgi:hypothetical protein